MQNQFEKKAEFPKISLQENAKYYLAKAGEIIRLHKHVDDMDFLISDQYRLILKPSDRSIKCPAKVESSVYQKIAAYNAHTFLRFRLIDDPDSIKLVLIGSDIMFKVTRIFSRKLNSSEISEAEIDDSYFWWKVDRASEKEDINIEELNKSVGICVCGICPRCIWRNVISRYPISGNDIIKVKQGLQNCMSIDDVIKFLDRE